jgi:type II secretory pathway pseudopilin PulG
MIKNNHVGFTITELVISITISGILAVAFFTATFYYYANTAQTETATTLALESQAILTQLTEDIRLADSIASTNALTDPNGPGGGWVTSDPSNILIIESPAITSARDIIYDSSTGSPYRNEFIYFMSGTKCINEYCLTLAQQATQPNVHARPHLLMLLVLLIVYLVVA